MVTLRWQRYAVQSSGAHTDANMYSDVRGQHTRCEVSNFTLADNFFRLTLIRWPHTDHVMDNVMVHAWLVESVFTEGTHCTSIVVFKAVWIVCVCVCPCIGTASWYDCMCLLLHRICASVFLSGPCTSMHLAFTACATVLLCHPTLPIIIHKKETALIPWDTRSHTLHMSKTTKNMQAVFSIN